jgi:hypothetical protein
VQWHKVKPGAFYYCPSGGAYVSENMVEEVYIGSLCLSDCHVQKWHSDCHPDITGHLCGSKDSAEFPSQRGRDSVFYCGAVVDGAGAVFSEEIREKIVEKTGTAPQFPSEKRAQSLIFQGQRGLHNGMFQ